MTIDSLEMKFLKLWKKFYVTFIYVLVVFSKFFLDALHGLDERWDLTTTADVGQFTFYNFQMIFEIFGLILIAAQNNFKHTTQAFNARIQCKDSMSIQFTSKRGGLILNFWNPLAEVVNDVEKIGHQNLNQVLDNIYS